MNGRSIAGRNFRLTSRPQGTRYFLTAFIAYWQAERIFPLGLFATSGETITKESVSCGYLFISPHHYWRTGNGERIVQGFYFSSKMSETLQTAADLPKIGHILKSEDIYTESKLSTFPKCWENRGIDFYCFFSKSGNTL